MRELVFIIRSFNPLKMLEKVNKGLLGLNAQQEIIGLLRLLRDCWAYKGLLGLL
jgi:hypothetical protein